MKDIHLKNSLKLSLVTLSRESEDKFISKFEKVIKLVNKISNFEVQINFNANKKKISTLREDKVEFSLSIEAIKNLVIRF